METADLDGWVTLSAFNGCAVGTVGCLAAALESDLGQSRLAGLGAAICACIWKHHLIDGGDAPPTD
jgi:hypothetical protein